MKIPRNLIFEDRKSLDRFGVREKGTLNNLVFNWLLQRGELSPMKEGYEARLLQVFNDAYYACTVALMYSFKLESLRFFYNECNHHSVEFPLICYYLSNSGLNFDYLSVMLVLFKTEIESHDDWRKNYKELIAATQYNEGSIPLTEFTPRELTQEMLSGIQWGKYTNSFKQEPTREILNRIAKNEDEWKMLVDAIKEGARDYEWEYNHNLSGGITDEGNWEEDSPITMSSYYEFLDDIRERFNERPEKKQVLLSYLDGADVIPSVRTTPPEDEQPYDDCFTEDTPLVRKAVKTVIIKHWGNNNANLALIELTLFYRDKLHEQSQHKLFVNKLIEWKILPDNTNVDDIARCMADKQRRLNKRGETNSCYLRDYHEWPENDKDRKTCMRIEKTFNAAMGVQSQHTD